MGADLKLEGKSNLTDLSSLVAGFTYTGIQDTQIKCETKPASKWDFTFEVTRHAGQATLGMKCGMDNITRPDLGLRVVQGPFFGSFLAKKQFQEFTAHGYYEVRPDTKLAATYVHGGKSANFSLGLAHSLSNETKLKAKVQQDQSVHLTLKHEAVKGFTKLFGMKWGIADNSFSYGIQVSIE